MKRILKGLTVLSTMIMVSGCQVVSNFIPTQTPYPTYTPNPTLTPYPTFTPLPSPTATPEKKVLFEENDFSGFDSCFDVYSDPDVRLFPESGEYHMVVQSPNYYSWALCQEDMDNFTLEVDATEIDGPDNNAYGIAFRRNSDDGAYYAFRISGDGYYSFGIIAPINTPPDDYFPILAWTTLREIRQGKKTNHLKVIAIGDQIELYVNDTLVGLVRDNTFSSGPFGFFVQAFEEEGVHVAFDNVRVTEP